jgi:DNA-binding winged helix-turn-helix (wHTH) protein
VNDEVPVLTISLVEQCLSLLRQQGLDYGCFTKTVLQRGYKLAQQQQQQQPQGQQKDDDDDAIHYHSGGTGSSNSVAQDYLERLMTAIVESEGVGSPNAVRLEQLRVVAP